MNARPPQDKALSTLVARVSRWSNTTVTLWCMVAVGAVAAADSVVGPYISLSVFYLIPLAVVTWRIGRLGGLATATGCGALWFLHAYAGMPPDLPLPVVFWSATVYVTFFILVMTLLSMLHDTLAHHRAMAGTDEGTGVANRRRFLATAAQELARVQRKSAPVTVVFIDCDNLKVVNDTLGHAAGDLVLRTVAQAARSELREMDTVARIGGDEFIVLLPETDEPAARAVVRKLRALLTDHMQRGAWPVTFSIGVATFLTPPSSVDELVQRADVLQYQVKHAGKNNVRFEVVPAVALAAA